MGLLASNNVEKVCLLSTYTYNSISATHEMEHCRKSCRPLHHAFGQKNAITKCTGWCEWWRCCNDRRRVGWIKWSRIEGANGFVEQEENGIKLSLRARRPSNIPEPDGQTISELAGPVRRERRLSLSRRCSRKRRDAFWILLLSAQRFKRWLMDSRGGAPSLKHEIFVEEKAASTWNNSQTHHEFVGRELFELIIEFDK